MTLHEALRDAAAEWRGAHAWRRFLPGAVVAVSGLAVAAWFSAFGLGVAALAVLLGWLVLAAGLLAGVWQARRGARALEPHAVATRLETLGGVRAGAVRTLLDPLAPGTSVALHEAATAARAAWVATHGREVLAPATAASRQGVRRILALLVVAAVALLLARPVGGAPAMLWRPWQAWQAVVTPVRLSSSAAQVDRGATVRFDIVALGQQRATLQVRAPGESWRARVIELDGDGRASIESEPLQTELVAKVTAGGRSSREVRVAMRLPVFLGAFTITAHYPSYLGLEQEVLPADGDTLIVPEGTRLEVTGRATTVLSSAALRSADAVVSLAVRDDRFAGALVPMRTGTWQLAVVSATGGGIDGMPPPLPVQVVADTAPLVDMPVPGSDTVAPPSMRLPVVIAVEDDHGIRAVMIEARRGATGPIQRIHLPLADGTTDRVLVSHALDLDALRLGAGDTLRYAAVATDNAPRAQVGRSREYLVRIPTAANQRAAHGEATSTTGARLDSLSRAARDAQRQAEDLARERNRGTASSDPAGGDPMAADAARRAERALEAQQQVERQAAALAEQLQALERAAERQGLADTALARQLGEIRELLERAMTPALREAMERLQSAVQDLDADRTRDALRDLAQEQARMRDAIDRARELFARAAMETDLANLAEEARELAEQQAAATRQLAADSAAGARTEEQLAARADSLARALERSAERVPSERAAQALQQGAEQTRDAAQQMRNAAQSARRGQRPQAQQQAQAAGEALQRQEQQIREEREELQEEMRQEVLGALDRLLAETSRLLTRQYTVAEAFRRGALAGPLRAEESMLEEGAGKLLEQVIEVSGKNALISPRIAVALAGARDGMRGAIEATSTVSPSLGLASDRAGEAVDMLSLAAYSLLRSRQNVENAESGSGLEEAMQQMQQMAGQQGELSDQGQSMIQQGRPELSAMQQLAMQQRAIAQQLERMRAQGQMPGAGELAQDARELSRTLEQGRLSQETIDRQQRLFRRMLDAGRSLQGEERDEQKERQSESATAGDRSRPGTLDPRLLRGAEFPLPSWEELQRLSSDDRRRVLDYFRRLTEAARP